MAAIIREADRRGLSAPPLWPPLPTAVELDVLKKDSRLVLGIGDDPLHRATPVIVHPLAHGLLISEESEPSGPFAMPQCKARAGLDETANLSC